MLQVEMSASIRNTSGKGAMRRLRVEGKTPAVVYGAGGEAQKLQLETKKLMTQLLTYYRRNTIVTLKVEGEAEKTVRIGEVQTDPVHDTLVHVDFCDIDLEKEREYSVPVNYSGISKGVELGGQLVVPHPAIILVGKPLDIPDECEVDITPLMIGDDVKCGSIAISDSVRMITDSEAIAVAVAKPGEKVEEDEEGEAVAETPVEAA